MQTLADLAESFHLYGVCESCRRVKQLPLQQLIAAEGADASVDQIRLRLTCRACGQRSQALRIVYVGPGGRSASFRYSR